MLTEENGRHDGPEDYIIAIFNDAEPKMRTFSSNVSII